MKADLAFGGHGVVRIDSRFSGVPSRASHPGFAASWVRVLSPHRVPLRRGRIVMRVVVGTTRVLRCRDHVPRILGGGGVRVGVILGGHATGFFLGGNGNLIGC